METNEDLLITGALGLTGEAGEVADLIKKLLYHGWEDTPEFREKLEKELGDVLWYHTLIAKGYLGKDLEDIMLSNYKKLTERHGGAVFNEEVAKGRQQETK